MADGDKSISEFCKVTGTDVPNAKKYLEAAAWDVSLAIMNYFEEGDGESASSEPAAVYQRPGSPKPKVPSSEASRIATFASLLQNQDSDEEEGQAFYAGGSERSGQQVLGPSKRKAANEIVKEMFKAVRTFGSEVDPSSQKPAKVMAFKGAGYVLGSATESSSNVVSGESEGPAEPMDICLRLWQSGFTIDDGPLREYEDPQNSEFLSAVRKGEIPLELKHRANGSEVHVNLEDHSHEEYVPKKPEVKAFSGEGFRLGNITPVVADQESSKPSQCASSEIKKLNLNESEPVTNIQIRLADGSRLTMQANHTHTIGDIRNFIVESRPEYGSSVFSLMTSFPTKELVNDCATLAEENLLNAVIVQRLRK